jgi:two-component system, NtrC family, sensor histidine kinase PilS
MSSMRRHDLTFDALVHDLNNVFQTIMDAAELMSADPNANPMAAIVLRSVEQGRRIVSSIVEADQGAIELEALVNGATAFTQDFIAVTRRPPLHFVRELRPGIKCRLKASALERVLVNLFINASQAAMGAQHKSCQITIRATECDGNVELVIEDDGPGIPPALLPVVFTPRFSTDATRSGLGLYIVRTLLATMGATISVKNGDSGGAVFSILLPRATVLDEADVTPTKAYTQTA